MTIPNIFLKHSESVAKEEEEFGGPESELPINELIESDNLIIDSPSVDGIKVYEVAQGELGGSNSDESNSASDSPLSPPLAPRLSVELTFPPKLKP
jgi:hypothetical protein